MHLGLNVSEGSPALSNCCDELITAAQDLQSDVSSLVRSRTFFISNEMKNKSVELTSWCDNFFYNSCRSYSADRDKFKAALQVQSSQHSSFTIINIFTLIQFLRLFHFKICSLVLVKYRTAKVLFDWFRTLKSSWPTWWATMELYRGGAQRSAAVHLEDWRDLEQ